MPKDRISLFRFIQENVRAVATAIGVLYLTPEQRTLLKGKWFSNAFEFGQRAALCREHHHRYLGDLPYTAIEVRDAFQEADDAEGYYILLQQLTRGVADVVLRRRARAFGMAIGIMQRMQALVANPFLDESARLEMEASLRRLRHDFDRRNKKISATTRKRHLAALAQGGIQAKPPEGANVSEDPEVIDVPDVIETLLESAPRLLETPRKVRAAGRRGRKA